MTPLRGLFLSFCALMGKEDEKGLVSIVHCLVLFFRFYDMGKETSKNLLPGAAEGARYGKQAHIRQ